MPTEISRTVSLAPLLPLLLVYTGVAVAVLRGQARRSATSEIARAGRSGGASFGVALQVPLLRFVIAFSLPFAILLALAALRG